MHVIGTAGHVDHGKSTLVQRLTGMDPDRFAEEKRRGLTIDLGFAWLVLPSGHEIGLIDVPGHERFIKNMLAGAGGISICMFVVAANEGWKPQSAEHLSIVDVLGISAGVVALTKSDAVDPETLEVVLADVQERIEASTLAAARVIPLSALTGEGIDELVAALDSLVNATPPAPDRGVPRLWVDRVFTIAGAGTVVTGTLAGGSFAAGDEVEIAPEGRRARIRAIQSHKKEVPRVGPGNRVALNLAGLERQGAQRGDAIVGLGQWRPTRTIDVLLRVIPPELTGRDHELTEKGAHLLYVGSAETPVRIKLLDARKLGPGESGYAQLQLRDPLPLERGDRFVLRDAGRVLTFGGGEVLDPLPRAARAGDGRAELLRRITGTDPDRTMAELVSAAGEIPATEAGLRTRASGLPSGTAQLGHSLVSRERLDSLAAVARGALEAHHRDLPLERGQDREALRAATGLDPEAFVALLARLDDVESQGSLVWLRSHAVSLDPEQQRARTQLLATLDHAGYSPPLAKHLDVTPALLKALTEAGELVKIDEFYLPAAKADEARAKVRAYIEEKGPATVAQIRDVLGTSRKYAVPLCEWLDATGATKRQGDLRTLGPHP